MPKRLESKEIRLWWDELPLEIRPRFRQFIRHKPGGSVEMILSKDKWGIIFTKKKAHKPVRNGKKDAVQGNSTR